jgi:hypothetical protein
MMIDVCGNKHGLAYLQSKLMIPWLSGRKETNTLKQMSYIFKSLDNLLIYK